MARVCALTGKKTIFGRSISRRERPSILAAFGVKTTGTAKADFQGQYPEGAGDGRREGVPDEGVGQGHASGSGHQAPAAELQARAGRQLGPTRLYEHDRSITNEAFWPRFCCATIVRCSLSVVRSPFAVDQAPSVSGGQARQAPGVSGLLLTSPRREGAYASRWHGPALSQGHGCSS